MPRPPNPQTPEAARLLAAIADSGRSQAEIAEALDVTPPNVSHYATGRRPIPWRRAEPVAALLGLAPEEISPEYRSILQHFESLAFASQLERLSADTVLSALMLFRNSDGGVVGFAPSIDEAPEEFALALKIALQREITDVESESEHPKRRGETSVTDRPQGAEQARGKSEPKNSRNSQPKDGSAKRAARKRA